MASKTTHITPAGGNVFLDLGIEPAEAERLKAHSDLIIQTKLAIAQSVGDWIKENDLKQEQVAKIFNVSRPRISDLANKKISKFTIDSLLGMLSKTDKEIHLEIR